jgi:hypothetical protein
MHSDGWGRSLDLVDDQLRRTFAASTVELKGISYRLGEIAYRGQPLSREDLRCLHRKLITTWQEVYSGTLACIGPQVTAETFWAEADERDAHHDTYSDGTPVSIIVQSQDDLTEPVPAEFREGDIPDIPNFTGNMDGLESPYLPPGYEVIVLDPPHKRPE